MIINSYISNINLGKTKQKMQATWPCNDISNQAWKSHDLCSNFFFLNIKDIGNFLITQRTLLITLILNYFILNSDYQIIIFYK